MAAAPPGPGDCHRHRCLPGAPNRRLPREQAFYERLSSQPEMLSDVAQDAGEGPDAKAAVARNRDVVFTVFEGGQPKMTAGLTGRPVAQAGEGFREIVAGDVPRQPQAVMISSRTKWSRMTLGA